MQERNTILENDNIKLNEKLYMVFKKLGELKKESSNNIEAKLDEIMEFINNGDVCNNEEMDILEKYSLFYEL